VVERAEAAPLAVAVVVAVPEAGEEEPVNSSRSNGASQNRDAPFFC
jgi:hypothetical protein